MSVYGPKGNQVASDDDSRGMDSFARVTIAEDGIHTVRVHDLLKRGGDTFAYRIEITPIVPKLSFFLTDYESASLVVPQGNRILFRLSTRRSDFDGLINFSFLDLPEGVTAEYGTFAQGRTEIPVLITATPEAMVSGALTSIAGIYEKEGLKVEGIYDQKVPLVFGRNKIVHLAQPVNKLALAVTDKAPFHIEFTVPKSPIIQRSTKRIKIVATRDEGFTAPIKVHVPYFPTGFGGGTLTIPEGKTEAYLQLEARPDAPLGEMKLAAIGESGGYQVATFFTPIPVDEPWIRYEMEELRLEQGKNVEVKVKVIQVKPYEGSYELEMRRLPKGVTTTKIPIDHTMTEVTFPLTVAVDAAAGKHGVVGFAVMLKQHDEDVLQMFPGNKITVFKPLPPELQKKPEPKPDPKVAKTEKPKPKRRTRFPETQ
ncbi:MAG: hypothetical protein COA73_07095 [Candidatus Hydrogenedentota bacterium]|nr:MAG: hypothetical protein COA73_07095 [Candidatus Hydrogenedentota bacterium]